MVLRRYPPYARRGAFAYIGQQTRPACYLGFMEHGRRAGTDRVSMQQGIQGLPHIPYFCIRAEIPGAPAVPVTGYPDARYLFVNRDSQIRIRFIISENNIEPRVELLDPRIFECQGFQFSPYNRPFKAPRCEDH